MRTIYGCTNRCVIKQNLQEMKKYTLKIFLMFFCFPSLNAQGDKVVFLELGGHALFYSVNYDFRFSKENNGFGLNSGLEFYPIGLGDEYDGAIFSIGSGINKTWGEGFLHPELGVGINLTSPSYIDRWTLMPHAVAAIRLQKYHASFFFRAAFYYNANFLYDYYEGIYPELYGGIGLGYTFN